MGAIINTNANTNLNTGANGTINNRAPEDGGTSGSEESGNFTNQCVPSKCAISSQPKLPPPLLLLILMNPESV